MNEFELKILDFIRNYLTNPLLDKFFPYYTFIFGSLFFWIIIFLYLLIKKDLKKERIIILTSIILEVIIVNIILKPLVKRIRPFDLNPNINLLVKKPTDYSFPSGHSASSFSFSSSLFFLKNKYAKYFILISVLVGISRLYLYVHYPSDVLAGTLIGILCGKLSNVIYDKYLKDSI